MFKGLEQTTSDIARQQTLNNGGGLTNGLDVSKNLADKKAVENRGESNYINNDSKSLSEIEQNSEKSIEFKTEKDNMYYNKFGGDLKTIASVSGSIDSDELIGKTKAGLKLTSEQVQDASTQKFTESTITASTTKEQIGQEDDYYNNANNIYREIARLDVNTDKGTVKASRQQNDAEQLNAAEMKQIDTVSKQNAEFNAKEKFGGAKAVSDEINKAEKEIETSEKVTISKNTKDYVAAGTGSGIEKSADYNAKADAVKTGELTLDRATNKEAALLTKGLVTPENEQNVANALHKMGKLENPTLEDLYRSQGQIANPLGTNKGEKLEAIVGQNGTLEGYKITQMTKDGLLEEYYDNKGVIVKSTLDKEMRITDKKVEDRLDEYKQGFKQTNEAGTQTNALEKEVADKFMQMSEDGKKNFVEATLLAEKAKDVNQYVPAGFSALGAAGITGVKIALANYYLGNELIQKGATEEDLKKAGIDPSRFDEAKIAAENLKKDYGKYIESNK